MNELMFNVFIYHFDDFTNPSTGILYIYIYINEPEMVENNSCWKLVRKLLKIIHLEQCIILSFIGDILSEYN